MVASVIKDDNLWLTQKSVADLFDCEPNNISYCINHIYSSNQLDEKSTYQIFRIVQTGGNRQIERNINFYLISPIFGKEDSRIDSPINGSTFDNDKFSASAR